jgi:glycosyltransferase involved in cell wall biosynthesis
VPTPLLTIVTVTWNCAATIQRTLESVKAVKDDDVEYVVIDGVSTDGTLAIIEAQDDLVDVLVSEPDTGIYNAMNKGARRAAGRYTLFINGDDALVADGFPAVMTLLRRGDADIVTATTHVGSETAPDEVLVSKPLQLPFFNSVPHPSSFVKTALLQDWGFEEDLKIAADYDFFLRALMAGKRFASVPGVTALHFRGGASGDIQRSQTEVDGIRRKRLGSLLYAITNMIFHVWRSTKRIFRKRAE